MSRLFHDLRHVQLHIYRVEYAIRLDQLLRCSVGAIHEVRVRLQHFDESVEKESDMQESI
jgi:hypothetical protein